MNSRVTQPHEWTRERYERLWELHMGGSRSGRPFKGLCWRCLLPASSYKPATTMRTWTYGCTACATRGFVVLPRQLYAPVALLESLADEGVERVGAIAHQIMLMGRAEAASAQWQTVLHGRKSRLGLSRRQLCLCCGEQASVGVFRDVHDRPYGVCGACKARTFHRSDYTMFRDLGWTRWMAQTGSIERWMEFYRLGEARWSGWLSAGATRQGAVAGAAQHDEQSSAQEVLG